MQKARILSIVFLCFGYGLFAQSDDDVIVQRVMEYLLETSEEG